MRSINRNLNGYFARVRYFLRAGSLSSPVLIAGLLFPYVSVAESVWPDAQWAQADPATLGLDQKAIGTLSAEIEAGRHGNIDSMMIIRHGQVVFDQQYEWDYAAQHKGLNYPSPPPWDYFNADAYPFHGNTDLHSLQSVSKSVMSALIGIAIERGELPGPMRHG